MAACVSYERIIALLQREDKIMAAGLPRNFFHLTVRCGGISQSDIFPHAPIKQKVILRDEGELFSVEFLRNFPNILSS